MQKRHMSPPLASHSRAALARASAVLRNACQMHVASALLHLAIRTADSPHVIRCSVGEANSIFKAKDMLRQQVLEAATKCAQLGLKQEAVL
jgi:hypothetical protein